MVIIILAILGLVGGSFVNALVWRLHEGKNWVSGRSECVYCHHQLSSIELVPLLSYIGLGGKCHYCHKHISLQYPLVELFTALVFIASYLYWPVSLKGDQLIVFVLWLIVVVGLVALIVYDIKWMLLPNSIVFSLIVVAFLMIIINLLNAHNKGTLTLDYIGACAVSGGIFYLIYILSKGKWIGGGDVKLGLLLGLLVATPEKGFLLLFLASLIGSIFSIPLMLSGKIKRKALIPFGPFLITACFIVELAGSSILHWYMQTLIYR